MRSKAEEVAADADEDDDPYRRLPVRAPIDEPPLPPPEPRPYETMWHLARAQGG